MGASKMIFAPLVSSVQTEHLSCIEINTISKRTKISFQLSLVTQEYHRVCPKRYLSLWYVWCKPCTNIALTLTPSPNRPNKIPHDPRQLGVPSVASKMISKPMVPLRKPCTYLALTLTPSPNGQNEISHDPHHLGVPSDASKMISEPMVRLVQTINLSYINTNTISEWTERDST